MHDNVYKYVLSSINSILEHGIDYYNNLDDNLKNKLMDVYEFINKEIKDNDDTKSCTLMIGESNSDKVTSNTKEIKALTDSFMNKMTDIKISVLNLENNLSLYYSEEDTNIQEDHDDLEITGIIEPITKLNDDLETTNIIAPISDVDIINTETLDIEKTEDMDDESLPNTDAGTGNNKSIFDIFKRKR